MEKIKLCEICGKEVVKGRDKHMNILNRYYHDECLAKEKTTVKETSPRFSEEQVARMTFDEKLTYLDDRLRNMTVKFNVPEDETIASRMILKSISDQYGPAAKAQEKSHPPST